MILILPRKTLNVSLQIFSGDPSLARQGLVSLTISSLNLYLSFLPIPGDEFLTTHTHTHTWIWIVPSMTLHMLLHVVAGDETLATQISVIWILPRMTLHVFLQVVAEFEFTDRHITMVLFLEYLTIFQSISQNKESTHLDTPPPEYYPRQRVNSYWSS